MLTLSMLFYFRISILAQIIPKHWVKTHRYVDVFRTYNWSQLLVTLIISILRYAVFSFQFYILLLAVGMVDLSLFSGLSIISSIFLLNTIRPSIALLEIGIRGSVALFIFGLYFGFDNGHEEAIFTASTLIWLINIIIPALIGLIFIKDLRFFKSKRA
jgi:hypothetical protein